MSLESALEEERLEILKLLERPKGPSTSGARSTPSSPKQRYSSLMGSAAPQPIRPVTSLLDDVPDVPSPRPGRSSVPSSGRNTPVLGFRSSPVSPITPSGIHRSRSDAASQPVPRFMNGRVNPEFHDPHAAYNFETYAPVVGSGLPRRLEKQAQRKGGAGRSSSPFGNPAFRSHSPRSSIPRVASPPPVLETKNRLLSEHGQLIDLEYAYAKLNDEALRRSGGSLGSLPERAPVVGEDGKHVRAGSGESITSNGGVRLQKDIDPDDETAVVDSTEDEDTDDTGDGGSEDEDQRGRPGSRTPSLIALAEDEDTGAGSRGNSSEREGGVNLGVGPGGKKLQGNKGRPLGKKKKRQTMSLLAAADEERKQVSAKQKYKVHSLLPQISVSPASSTTNIPGATSPTMVRKSGVHPSTNFDDHSAISTPYSSDQEADDIDIRRAQRMEMSISPIISNPESQRVLRTIVRGDYPSFQSETASGKRRARRYLVATDLSSEAQYAMEWTIGTVLRDGDTLMAIYAADQDTVEDGGKSVAEATASDIMTEINSQAHSAATGTLAAHVPNTSSPLAQKDSAEGSRERTKAERERFTAVEAITNIITKLLKKTKLQIKCVVEVIHCKSPKHLLIEIIDLVEPTLVILGSRGRSALKGVLLGSFSNYLVTKSSVPVMVARKKLKHTKKYQHTNVRLTNNLTSNTARILANAKVD